MRFCVNVSILFTEVPLLERFAPRARGRLPRRRVLVAAGEDPTRCAAAVADAGVEVVLLNFDAGDMAGGRPRAALRPRPARRVPGQRAGRARAGRASWAAGCSTRSSGSRSTGWSARPSSSSPRDNVALAADAAAEQGADVLIEAVNTFENGPYLLPTTQQASAFVRSVGRDERPAAVRRVPHAAHGGGPHRHDRAPHGRDRPRPGRRLPRARRPGTGEINYAYVFAASRSWRTRPRRPRVRPPAETPRMSLGVVAAPRRAATDGPGRSTAMPRTRSGSSASASWASPMAAQPAAAGYRLVVHSRSRRPVDELVAAGAQRRAEPARGGRAGRRRHHDAARLARTSRRSARAEDGCSPAARPGALLIDMSTIAPATSRRGRAAAGAERGVGAARRAGQRRRRRRARGHALDHGRRRRRATSSAPGRSSRCSARRSSTSAAPAPARS